MSVITFEGVRSISRLRVIFDDKFWNLIKNLTKSDQMEILARNLELSHNRQDHLKLLLQKCEELLSKNEIIQILGNKNIFFWIFKYDFLWKYFVNHTSHKQQIAMLNQTKIYFENICYPIGLLFWNNFDSAQEIYESYFNQTELQEYILSHPTDTLLFFVLIKEKIVFGKICKFLLKTFQNNENLLKNFLIKKIEPTNLNIFDLLIDFDDPEGNLKELSLLFESI